MNEYKCPRCGSLLKKTIRYNKKSNDISAFTCICGLVFTQKLSPSYFDDAYADLIRSYQGPRYDAAKMATAFKKDQGGEE